ncbi:hypothetical protein FZI91_21495 [Mycobacterium sp. CBMA271]|uniref:hypothetical protein n=1 Tax=unclassified Mycobacteroides TaxID=2618759 RepID=UPI0012DF9033|nr:MULTISPECIES: hypothetical protein [unclassified Mycobacteroides]MUM19659.1 hypothetical protein [Mycobacteroides sp. CBMA 326]MUM24261.1 hypothetical protein [Mycobacteroides sp. CBMA 271]
MTQPQYPQGQYQQPQQQFPGYQQPGVYGPPPGGYAPTPKPPRPPMSPQQKALAVVGGSLAVFLVALLILGLATSKSSTETTAAPDQIVNSQDSDTGNEQDVKAIKQTIAGMAEAAKANDFKKMLTFFCAKYRDALKDLAGSGKAPDLSSLTKSDNGPSKITGIDIKGDTAVLHVTDAKGKHDIEFARESGSWKFCPKIK